MSCRYIKIHTKPDIRKYIKKPESLKCFQKPDPFKNTKKATRSNNSKKSQLGQKITKKPDPLK